MWGESYLEQHNQLELKRHQVNTATWSREKSREVVERETKGKGEIKGGDKDTMFDLSPTNLREISLKTQNRCWLLFHDHNYR